MSKTTKQSRRPIKFAPSLVPPRSYYAIERWICKPYPDHTEIMAYVEASGAWETVMTVHPTSGAGTEELAIYVSTLINQFQNRQNALREAVAALGLAVDEDSPPFSAHTSNRIFPNIQQVSRR